MYVLEHPGGWSLHLMYLIFQSTVVGLDGEDGRNVQRPVEVETESGEGRVTILHHSLKEINVLEVLPKMATVILIPVPVRIKFR